MNQLPYEDRFIVDYSAASSGTSYPQSQNFWAKGTGFGSGTTQQQWNVDLHVLRRKFDENTVTLLLKVNISYPFRHKLDRIHLKYIFFIDHALFVILFHIQVLMEFVNPFPRPPKNSLVHSNQAIDVQETEDKPSLSRINDGGLITVS